MGKMELIVNVHARFMRKNTGEPLHGKDYTVQLFDKDIIQDDHLGEESPDKEGNVHFKVDPKSYRTNDSLLEKRPDFYMIVLKDAEEIFRTEIAQGVNIENEGQFNIEDGEWINMGIFLIADH